VENTTIDQAVDQLLTRPDIEEVTEEEQQETPSETEASAEYELDDDLELTDEDLEDEGYELSEQDLEEDNSEPDLFDVKSNGEWKKVTLDALKQSYAGQDYIQKGMRENAEQAKQLEQERAAFQKLRDQTLSFYQNLQQNGLKPPTPPSLDDFNADPLGYVERKAQYDAAKADYDQKIQQINLLNQQRQEQEMQEHNSYLRQQAEILTQYIPEMADKEKSEVVKKQLFDVGAYYGFSAEEIGQVADARYFRALNDARKYRQLVEKRGKAQKPGSKISPVKAGAKKNPAVRQSATRQKQIERLKKSGKVSDAIDLLLNNPN
jgi:hypothetical protein